MITALGSLRADFVFACRQLIKRKVATTAAVLSLALAIGACSAAFRLVDALFLRPMPVRDPASLYSVAYAGYNPRTGEPNVFASNSYPMFRRLRDAVRSQADVIAVSFVDSIDLTFGAGIEMEKVYRQSVSGEVFSNLGLRPYLGRLLNRDDDQIPGAKPYAVLSYDYWTRRFGEDRSVIGRTFHLGATVYEIVGVVPKGFTGTEPGATADIFLPTMMEAGSVNRDNSFWLRLFVRVKPGVDAKAVAIRMDAVYHLAEKERAKTFANFPKHLLAQYPTEHLTLDSAAAGASNLQTEYGSALAALCALVAMVLLIACANVANLLSVQATARAREWAVRISIGASRYRLLQMVMVESALLGLMATATGLLFAGWAATFVVQRINPPGNPTRSVLSMDGGLLEFAAALAFGVTFLFGCVPAWRASRTVPGLSLKITPSGGRAKSRLMYILAAMQVAFCVLVLFVAGLFAATFETLAARPTGFSAARLLLLDMSSKTPQQPVKWDQMAEALRAVPGVRATALEAWPLLSGTMHNDRISVNNSPPSETLAFFLAVSPGWLDVMKIPRLSGRDFRPEEASTGAAIVNQTFAKLYFNGANPIGRSFVTKGPTGIDTKYNIVGLARDVSYRQLREETLPQVYIPIRGSLRPISNITLVVRTASVEPLSLAEPLRQALTGIDSGFRLHSVTTQSELVEAQSIRERLLANLGLFFAIVALLLAAVGLYGVLAYSVVQRQKEIGIRMAVGARASTIVSLLTNRLVATVLIGEAIGLTFGLATARFVQSLLYGVKPTDPALLARPALVLLAASLLAALPAIVRAVRIDPAIMLRAE